MSDSTDNTNELDSYGVWVKNTPAADDSNTNSPDDFNFSDSLDIPDFEESQSEEINSDFSDIFSDQTAVEEPSMDTDSNDTTLTSDELLNITNTNAIIDKTSVESPSANDDMFNLNVPEFDSPILEDSSFAENAVSSEEVSEKSESTTESDDMFAFDDQMFNNDVFKDTTFDNSEVTEQIDIDSVDTSIENIEVPSILDNETQSDDLNSLEQNFSATLDTTEEIHEDKTIQETAESENTDIGFDLPDFNESTDLFKTDEPVENLDVTENFETEITEETVSADEEISLDDFMDGGFSDVSVAAGNNGFEPGAEPQAQSSSASEEISLDDFLDGGFESEQKQEETIVDEKPLDMQISFDSSVDSVQTEDNVSMENDSEEDEDETDSFTDTFEVDTQIEGQTEETEDYKADESSAKLDAEEIDLSDFGIDANAEETPVTQDVKEQKVKEQIVDYDLTVSDNAAAAPIVNEIKSSDAETEPEAELEEITEVPSGSVGVDNSLLQQIVNDLTSLRDEINTLKSNITEIKNNPIQKDISDDLNFDDVKDEGGFFSQDDGDDTIALSNDELNNIMNTAEINQVDSVVMPEEQPEENLNIEDTIIEETTFDIGDETSVSESEVTQDFNFAEEKLEEPDINKIDINSEIDSIEFPEQEENLPDEISIPKDEENFGSTDDDFSSSIENNSDATIDGSFLDQDLDLQGDLPDELPNTSDTPAQSEIIDSAENTSFDSMDDFVTGEEKNNLSDSNINYLTEEDIPPEVLANGGENNDLKKDIKSVLLYMDQLLENLPEEKIVEFAKSEEFATYKKLFSELGLS